MSGSQSSQKDQASLTGMVMRRSGGGGGGGGDGGEYRRVKCYVRVRPLIEHELTTTTTTTTRPMTPLQQVDTVSNYSNNSSSLYRRSPVELPSPSAADPSPLSCVAVGDDGKSVRLANDVPATFDGVFLPDSTLQEMSDALLASTLKDVMLGYHNALLFYGQTGSGKTHTVQELVPTFVHSLFHLIRAEEHEYETTVSLECVQIYLERVSDLLDTRRTNLQIREFPDTGVYVRGAVEQTVSSAEELLTLWDRATTHRVTAETRLNPVSSRSHCVAAINVRRRRLLRRDELDDVYGEPLQTSTVHVNTSLGETSLQAAAGWLRQRSRTPDRTHRRSSRNSVDGRHAQTGAFFRAFTPTQDSQEEGEGRRNTPQQQQQHQHQAWTVNTDGVPSVTCGKVFFVDLAGSERLKASQSEGLRQTEAIHINQSLSTLGKVMSALANPKATHVPYRDSKLTRMLQESLGGGGCSAVVVCLSPWSGCLAESRLTVSFGLRAMEVVQSVSAWREVDGRARLMEVQEWLEHRVHYLEEKLRVTEEERHLLLVLNGSDTENQTSNAATTTGQTLDHSHDTCKQCQVLQAEVNFLRNESCISQRSLAAATSEFERRVSQLEAALEVANNDCEYYISELEEAGIDIDGEKKYNHQHHHDNNDNNRRSRSSEGNRKGVKSSALAQRKMTELNEYWEGYASSVEAELMTVTAERDDACKELFAMTQRFAVERSSILDTSSAAAGSTVHDTTTTTTIVAELETLQEELQQRDGLIRDLQATMDARELRFNESIALLQQELDAKVKAAELEKSITLEAARHESEALMRSVMEDLNRLNDRFTHVDAARAELERLAQERETIIHTQQQEVNSLQQRLKDETHQHEDDVERLHAAAAVKDIEIYEAQREQKTLTMALERQSQRLAALEESYDDVAVMVRADAAEKERLLHAAAASMQREEESAQVQSKLQHSKMMVHEEEVMLAVAQERARRLRRELAWQEECDRTWLHCEAAESYADSLYSLLKLVEHEACVMHTDTMNLQKYVKDMERKQKQEISKKEELEFQLKENFVKREHSIVQEWGTVVSMKEKEMESVRHELVNVTRRALDADALQKETAMELGKVRSELEKCMMAQERIKKEEQEEQQQQRVNLTQDANKKLFERTEEMHEDIMQRTQENYERIIEELHRNHREALMVAREEAEKKVHMIHETSASAQSSLNRTLQSLTSQLTHAEEQLREERETLKSVVQSRESEMAEMEAQLKAVLYKQDIATSAVYIERLISEEENARLHIQLEEEKERMRFTEILYMAEMRHSRDASVHSISIASNEEALRIATEKFESEEARLQEMISELQNNLDHSNRRYEELMLMMRVRMEEDGSQFPRVLENGNGNIQSKENDLTSLRDALVSIRDVLLLVFQEKQDKERVSHSSSSSSSSYSSSSIEAANPKDDLHTSELDSHISSPKDPVTIPSDMNIDGGDIDTIDLPNTSGQRLRDTILMTAQAILSLQSPTFMNNNNNNNNVRLRMAETILYLLFGTTLSHIEEENTNTDNSISSSSSTSKDDDMEWEMTHDDDIIKEGEIHNNNNNNNNNSVEEEEEDAAMVHSSSSSTSLMPSISKTFHSDPNSHILSSSISKSSKRSQRHPSILTHSIEENSPCDHHHPQSQSNHNNNNIHSKNSKYYSDSGNHEIPSRDPHPKLSQPIIAKTSKKRRSNGNNNNNNNNNSTNATSTHKANTITSTTNNVESQKDHTRHYYGGHSHRIWNGERKLRDAVDACREAATLQSSSSSIQTRSTSSQVPLREASRSSYMDHNLKKKKKENKNENGNENENHTHISSSTFSYPRKHTVELDPRIIARMTEKRHRDVRELIRMGRDPSGTSYTHSGQMGENENEDDEEELKPYHRWITDAHRQVNRRLIERLDYLR